MKPNGLTYVSLFCGCGGFDLGFNQAGFRCISAFDHDEHAVRVHKQNLRSPIELRDLSLGMPIAELSGEVDVLLAGPLCQGFSTVGRRDPQDPRNFLLTVPAVIASMVQSKVVIVENVPGVTADNQRRHWERLIHLLRAEGYQTFSVVLDLSRHGVPQVRRRMILIGWNTGRVMTPAITERDGGVIWTALQNLRGTTNHSPLYLQRGSEAERIASRIQAGQKLCNVRAGDRAVHTWEIPEVFGKTNKQ